MILIILSIVTGFIGATIGAWIGGSNNEFFIHLFMAVGILSPSLYILDKIYRKLTIK